MEKEELKALIREEARQLLVDELTVEMSFDHDRFGDRKLERRLWLGDKVISTTFEYLPEQRG